MNKQWNSGIYGWHSGRELFISTTQINLEYWKNTHKSGLAYRRVISRTKAKFKRRLFVRNKWNRLYILSASHAWLIDQFLDLRAIRPFWVALLCSSAVLLTMDQTTVCSAESTHADTRGHHTVPVVCKYLRKYLESGLTKYFLKYKDQD